MLRMNSRRDHSTKKSSNPTSPRSGTLGIRRRVASTTTAPRVASHDDPPDHVLTAGDSCVGRLPATSARLSTPSLLHAAECPSVPSATWAIPSGILPAVDGHHPSLQLCCDIGPQNQPCSTASCISHGLDAGNPLLLCQRALASSLAYLCRTKRRRVRGGEEQREN